jgi:hypothetical protein
MFVDRGRRWLLTLPGVVFCIMAIALWWVMLALAFTDGTSGANPPFADRASVDRAAEDGAEVISGPRR